MSASQSPEINEALTQKMANLARLELSDAELKTFTAQVIEIFRYVEQLQEVNVDGIEPLTHAFELGAPLREDVVVPFETSADGKPKILECAPEVLQDGFKVPPIL